jgi:hypothetical protein
VAASIENGRLRRIPGEPQNRGFPEKYRGIVRLQYTNLPHAREPFPGEVGRFHTHSAPPVLPENEELGDLPNQMTARDGVRLLNKHEPGRLTVDFHEEGMPVGFKPIFRQITVNESAVGAKLYRVKCAEFARYT